LQAAGAILDELGVRYETRIVSAHRTPTALRLRESCEIRGLKAIIAGAGGAAHLPGMTASMTSCRCSASRLKRERSRASTACFPSPDAGRHSGRDVRHRRGRAKNAGLFAAPCLRLKITAGACEPGAKRPFVANARGLADT